MTRNGKIARLPREVRHELNQRLQDGEPGVRLVEWLNGLKAVKQVVAKDFGGREITEDNLSEWKQGGYEEWCAQQETLSDARELAANASELAEAGQSLANHLATTLTAKYAALVRGWHGEVDEEFHRKARTLRTLCLDVAELRRGEQSAERLQLNALRTAALTRSGEAKAWEGVLRQIEPWPEVKRAMRTAFELWHVRKFGHEATEDNNPTGVGLDRTRSD